MLKDRGKDEHMAYVTAAAPVQTVTEALALRGQCLTDRFQFSLVA